LKPSIFSGLFAGFWTCFGFTREHVAFLLGLYKLISPVF